MSNIKDNLLQLRETAVGESRSGTAIRLHWCGFLIYIKMNTERKS